MLHTYVINLSNINNVNRCILENKTNVCTSDKLWLEIWAFVGTHTG